MNLRAVERVAPIVPRPIDDVLHVRVERSAAQFEEALRDLEIRARVSAADVVDFTLTAVLERVKDSARVIFGVKPIADLQAVTVEGNGPVLKEVRREERDELLGKLVRAERI